MRLFTFAILAIICLNCNNEKKTSANHNPLNGTWTPTRQEIGGNTLPPAAFEKQRLVVDDNKYSFTAESVDKGEVTYKDGRMDIYGKEGVNTGKHFTAIYQVENGLLSICYNLAGDSYPAAFDTKGHPTYFLCVFKKM